MSFLKPASRFTKGYLPQWRTSATSRLPVVNSSHGRHAHPFPCTTPFTATPCFVPTAQYTTNRKENACYQHGTEQKFDSTDPKTPRRFPCVDHIEERSRQLATHQDTPHRIRGPPGHQVFHYPHRFQCDYKGYLPEFTLAYETWGQLNATRDNAILLHTGLSASSHAKSHPANESPGWWEKFIGPGRAIDTNQFFVICTNVLGGCYGSTGPSSIDPRTDKPYATAFPMLSIHDMVRAQFYLLDHLNITKLHASVGASMGGMQSLVAGAMYPQRVARLVSISACARSHPYSIAMRHVQRQVLMSDPHWRKGYYYDHIPPHAGMKLAREIATISYRSGPEWERRFGRQRVKPESAPEFCPDFLIETYLDRQGERFCLEYDPNSLLYISKAMDLFDMSYTALEELVAHRDIGMEQKGHSHGAVENSDEKSARGPHPPYPHVVRVNADRISQHSPRSTSTPFNPTANPTTGAMVGLDTMESRRDLIKGLQAIQIPTLVLGVKSDILFPVWQQQEIAQTLRRGGNQRVTYYELDALYGHDTFLIDAVNIGAAVKGHLENVVEL
ncbi:homoserine O-acetyltransferase [Dispira parvispora]|uniref:Homoserine O-acetyltransferase n=1 Tax=Dispira parvispora TaxID=1520584 RepID=A0A9W8B0W5_9FUNG|nr:homoserine O-acetyltransferase [Dispira parvispora]